MHHLRLSAGETTLNALKLPRVSTNVALCPQISRVMSEAGCVVAFIAGHFHKVWRHSIRFVFKITLYTPRVGTPWIRAASITSLCSRRSHTAKATGMSGLLPMSLSLVSADIVWLPFVAVLVSGCGKQSQLSRVSCAIRHMEVFEDRLELVGVGALPSRTIPLPVCGAPDAIGHARL